MKDNRPSFSWCCVTELVDWAGGEFLRHICVPGTKMFLHFPYHELGKHVTRISLQRWQ